MHLSVRLPKVQPQEIKPRTHCPLPNPRQPKRKCSGTHFKVHEVNCRKPVRDTRHSHVIAQRYRCLTCRRSFRVYPTGVSHNQQSDTLKGLSVLLYVLGLSYQGVANLLEMLEYALAKSTVYKNVQAAGARAIGLREGWLQQQAGQVSTLSLVMDRLGNHSFRDREIPGIVPFPCRHSQPHNDWSFHVASRRVPWKNGAQQFPRRVRAP